MTLIHLSIIKNHRQACVIFICLKRLRVMNTFNESPARSITNNEIKIIAGIVALALLTAIYFVYGVPYLYDRSNLQKANENAGAINTSTTNDFIPNKIVTPIDVNI